MNNPMMEALIQKMAAENPKLLPMMQLMQQQQANAEDSKSGAIDPKILLKKEIKKRRRLMEHYEELVEEAQLIENLLDELAGALGACPSCWGTNDECTMCEGNGSPGTYQPDKELFQHYVLPILKNTPWVRQIFIQEINN